MLPSWEEFLISINPLPLHRDFDIGCEIGYIPRSINRPKNIDNSYAKYIAEHLERNIEYADYIAKNLERSIEYANYIAEHVGKYVR